MTAAAIAAKTALVTIVIGMTAGAIAGDVVGIIALMTTATAQRRVSAGKFKIRCTVVVECPQ